MYLEPPENVTDSEYQPLPPPLPRTETYSGNCAPLSNHIAEPWGYDAHGSLATHLQNTAYYLFPMHEEYKSIQHWIKKQGMNTYYNITLINANTTLLSPSFKNRVGIQKLIAAFQIIGLSVIGKKILWRI